MTADNPKKATDVPAAQGVFTDIYTGNKWKGSSVSGPGSSLKSTELIRPALQSLFERLKIRSLCDAPCGDGTWIFDITAGLDLYIGVDVVIPVIQNNVARGLPPKHVFAVSDISQTVLPSVDAILCRDCLVHLPLEMAANVLRNFRKSGSKYLITTTFPDHESNSQARIGTWRPLNLTKHPFDLPQPMRIIRERVENYEDRYNDKSLAVWDLTDSAIWPKHL